MRLLCISQVLVSTHATSCSVSWQTFARSGCGTLNRVGACEDAVSGTLPSHRLTVSLSTEEKAENNSFSNDVFGRRKAIWARNRENEEELQQGSHARHRDLEMMKQKPTLEQRTPKSLTSPPVYQSQSRRQSRPLPSHFMPSRSFSSLQGGEVWNQINSLPHLPASWTPWFPPQIFVQCSWVPFHLEFLHLLVCKKGCAMATKNSSIDPLFQ